MTTPDGMPVAWRLRKLGFPCQQRINGPDLMWKYCKCAAQVGQAIFFYGSTKQILGMLQTKLRTVFPALKIAGVYSPSFRELTEEEDQKIVNLMNRSGAKVVFVGLGCPKQEKWMAAHRGRVHAVMIGVGAAFDYHAGMIKRAPLWMQNVGLEWLFRLISEPRRLWRRYLVTNSKFIWMLAKEKMNRQDVDLKENRS
jgi:N-acetylglucosaminyldiphosphoundecaprenol N-acetyl-beta-D-mannosaminyltransferase